MTSQNNNSDFHEKLQRLLALDIPSLPAKVKSTLFPPDQPPVLMVYFGEADEQAVQTVRDQLPSHSILFWICPPGHDDAYHALTTVLMKREERTLVGLPDDWWNFEEAISSLMDILPQRSVQLIIHQSFKTQYPEACTHIQQAIKRTMDNVSMDTSRGLIFLRASLLNLGIMSRRWMKELPAVPSGMDAVVCGAGPSLRCQLDLLKDLQGKVLMISVGHALPVLLHAGIHPQIVVEDDACAGINWPEKLDVNDMLLVAASTVDTRVSSRFKDIYWCQGSSPLFNQMLDIVECPLTKMTLYKTVSAHAIEVAVRMGCTRIAMVGQDFSLGKSGVLHADNERSVSTSELLEDVPANAGGTVQATKDLVVLREAVEEYIEMLKRVLVDYPTQPVLINCTDGGALIRGTERIALDEFAASLNTVDSIPSMTSVTAPCQPLVALAKKELERAGNYIEHTERIISCSKKLVHELEHHPLDMNRVRDHQAALQDSIHQEKEWLKGNANLIWTAALFRYAEKIIKETSAPTKDIEEPIQQLSTLINYYQLTRDLTRDLGADLNATLRPLQDPSGISSRASEVFPAFRQFASRIIRRNNRYLSDWINQQPEPLSLERFRFRWKNQVVPGMEVRSPDGDEFISVAGEWSMIEDARREVQAFFSQYDFDPARHGVVVVGPCNWIHVLEMLREHPDFPLIVIEPWIDSLTEQIKHGMFLHRLPPDALIIGADYRVKKWKHLLSSRMGDWRKKGLQPLYFSPSRIAQWEEIRVLTNPGT